MDTENTGFTGKCWIIEAEAIKKKEVNCTCFEENILNYGCNMYQAAIPHLLVSNQQQCYPFWRGGTVTFSVAIFGLKYIPSNILLYHGN